MFLHQLLNDTRLSPSPLNESHDSLLLDHKVYSTSGSRGHQHTLPLFVSELHRAQLLSLTPQSIHQDKDFAHARTCCLILWKPICHISGLLHAHSVILHLDKHTQTLLRLLATKVKTMTVWSGLKATLSPPKMPSALPCPSVINAQMRLSRNACPLDLTAQG